MRTPASLALRIACLLSLVGCGRGQPAGRSGPASRAATRPAAAGWTPLFPADSLAGWRVSHWSDLRLPQQVEGQAWKAEGDVLYGLGKRTWLYSQAEYGDFEMTFEVRISQGANGGVGLRFPPAGDPAYTGMELQVVDHEVYYRGRSRPEQRTASIYDEIAADAAPSPVDAWTAWRITLLGRRVTIAVDGRVVLDADLSAETQARQQKGPALAERPLRGRIGFQNLNGQITFRKLRIRRR